MDRLRISLRRQPAMVVNRISVGDQRLVYVICANRKIPYPDGSSPIMYIGTTKNGIARVAQSAAYRADDVLSEHGVNSFEVRIVTCTPRQRIKSWHVMERAMLIRFRDIYGRVPWCNTVGKGILEAREFEYFSRERVTNILENLAESGVATDRTVTA